VFYDDVLYRTTFTLPYCIWNFYPILWLHAKFYLNRFILLPLINAETLNLPCFHVHYTVVAQAAQRRWTRLSNYKPSPRYNDIKIVQTSWCRSRIHNRCRWKATRANKNIKLFCSPTKAKSQPPNLIEEVRTILHLQTNTTHGFAASRRWRFGVNRPSRLNTITLEPFVRKKQTRIINRPQPHPCPYGEIWSGWVNFRTTLPRQILPCRSNMPCGAKMSKSPLWVM